MNNQTNIFFGMVQNKKVYLKKHNKTQEGEFGQLVYEDGSTFASIYSMFISPSATTPNQRMIQKLMLTSFVPNFDLIHLDNIIDSFAQAYEIYKTKEIYEFGTGGISLSRNNPIYNIKNKGLQALLEQDIQKILDHVWQYANQNKLTPIMQPPQE